VSESLPEWCPKLLRNHCPKPPELPVKAYEMYLNELACGEKSKVTICNGLETDSRFMRKIDNCRQEFARYDDYFTGMENKINIALKPSKNQEHIKFDREIQLKVLFFKTCLKYLKRRYKLKSFDKAGKIF